MLAPAAPAEALRGDSAADVRQVLAWESAALAGLMSPSRRADARLRPLLAPFEAVLAYTRNPELAAGLGRYCGTVLDHDPDPRSAPGHVTGWLARPLARLGVPRSLHLPAAPVPRPTAHEAAAAAAHLRALPEGFLAIHAGSGSPAKNWPTRLFLALARRLSGGRPWLWVQGPADPAPPPGTPDVVVARNLPLRTLAALLSHAALFVGNDSGVSHLAAAWGTPVLALFGPTRPERWAPLGPRVTCLRAPEGTMQALSSDDVEAAARTIWGAPQPPGRRVAHSIHLAPSLSRT